MKLDLLVFLLLFGSFGFFQHSEPGWNVNSRFALALAFAESGSARVERYVTLPGLQTQDLAEYGGHLYSDKSIGTSLLGVPAVWAVKALEVVADTTFTTATRRWVVTWLSVGLSGAISGVLLMHWLSRLWQRGRLDNSYFVISGPGLAEAFTAVAVTLGSMLFLYGTLFMSYLPAHMFLLAALLTLETALDRYRDEGRVSYGLFLLSGLFGGLCSLCEYTYAAALVFVAGYLIHRIAVAAKEHREMDDADAGDSEDGRSDGSDGGFESARHWRRKDVVLPFVLYGVGGVIGMLPFLIYTMTIFGRPAIPYEFHVMPEFREAMAKGFMGAGVPDMDALWLITFHPFRGMFVYSPLLFIGLCGLLWMAARAGSLRAAAWLCLGCSGFYFVFNSAYYMWWGGWSFSPRHLAPAVPFLAAGLLPLMRTMGGRIIAAVAAVVGIVVHTLVNATEPQPPDGGWQVALLRPDMAAFDYPVQFADTWRRVQAGAFDGNLGTLLGISAGWGMVLLVAWWVVLGWLMVRVVRGRNRAVEGDR